MLNERALKSDPHNDLCDKTSSAIDDAEGFRDDVAEVIFSERSDGATLRRTSAEIFARFEIQISYYATAQIIDWLNAILSALDV